MPVSAIGGINGFGPYMLVVHVLLETLWNTRKPRATRLPVSTWGHIVDDRRIYGLETSGQCFGYIDADHVDRARRKAAWNVPEHAVRVACDDTERLGLHST